MIRKTLIKSFQLFALSMSLALVSSSAQSSELIRANWPNEGDALWLLYVELTTEVPGAFIATGLVTYSSSQELIETAEVNSGSTDEVLTYRSKVFLSLVDCNLGLKRDFHTTYFSSTIPNNEAEVYKSVGPQNLEPTNLPDYIESVCEQALLLY